MSAILRASVATYVSGIVVCLVAVDFACESSSRELAESWSLIKELPLVWAFTKRFIPVCVCVLLAMILFKSVPGMLRGTPGCRWGSARLLVIAAIIYVELQFRALRAGSPEGAPLRAVKLALVMCMPWLGVVELVYISMRRGGRANGGGAVDGVSGGGPLDGDGVDVGGGDGVIVGVGVMNTSLSTSTSLVTGLSTTAGMSCQPQAAESAPVR